MHATLFFFIGVWLIALVAFWPVVEKVKHPEVSQIKAYLEFVALFSTASYTLFGAYVVLLLVLDLTSAIDNVFGAALLIAATLIPAYRLGKAIIARRPSPAPDLH